MCLCVSASLSYKLGPSDQGNTPHDFHLFYRLGFLSEGGCRIQTLTYIYGWMNLQTDRRQSECEEMNHKPSSIAKLIGRHNYYLWQIRD